MTFDVQQFANALLDRDVYIVLESQNPPELTRLPGAIGVTGGQMDAMLKPWLESRGEYRGRRSAIYLNDIKIDQLVVESAAAHGLNADELRHDITVATVVHEGGHIALHQPKPVDQEITPAVTRFAELLAAYSVTIHESDSHPPFEHHDQHFIRATLHLWHRAQRLGETCPIEYLYDHERYGVPPADYLFYLLQDEPRNLSREPITEIRTFQPPLLFVRAMQQTMDDWISQQPADSPLIDAAVAIRNNYPYPERIY